MKRFISLFYILSLLCLCAPLYAQDAPPPKPTPETGTQVTPPEPVKTPPKPKPVKKTFPDQKDQDTKQKLQAALSQIESLKGIEVTVFAGVVTLRGKTPDTTSQERAIALASKLSGVLTVESKLTLENPEPSPQVQARSKDAALQKEIEELFSQIKVLDNVKVSVRSGVVTLSGTVLTSEAATRAQTLAEKMAGVLYVDNGLRVETAVKERVSPAVSKLITLAENGMSLLPLIALGLVILLLFGWLAGAISRWDWPYRRFETKPLVREIIRQILHKVVFFSGVLLVLELLDITSLVGAVLGTAGVAGLALGFAFRDIVENYLASVILSWRQPFRKGDAVKIGSHEGKIVRMTTRDTVLMTYNGNHLRIPNADVFKSVMYNYSLNPLRRFDFGVGVGCEANLTQVRKLGLEAICGIDGVLDDPAPFMLIEDLGDSNVLIRFYGWVDQREHGLGSTRTEAIRRVKLLFEQSEIEMPEPIYRVNLVDTTPDEGIVQLPKKKESLHEDSIAVATDEEAQLARQIAADIDATDERDLLD